MAHKTPPRDSYRQSFGELVQHADRNLHVLETGGAPLRQSLTEVRVDCGENQLRVESSQVVEYDLHLFSVFFEHRFIFSL